jgi:hypothetical protein
MCPLKLAGWLRAAPAEPSHQSYDMIYSRQALHQEAESGWDWWEGADMTGEDVR